MFGFAYSLLLYFLFLELFIFLYYTIFLLCVTYEPCQLAVCDHVHMMAALDILIEVTREGKGGRDREF